MTAAATGDADELGIGDDAGRVRIARGGEAVLADAVETTDVNWLTAPGSTAHGGGIITGAIDTHLLDPTETQYVVLHVAVNNFQAWVHNFSDTSFAVGAHASIWLNSHVYDRLILRDGLDDGFGNEFNIAPDGTLSLTNPVDFGSAFTYYFTTDSFAEVDGQADGAQAFATADASLVRIDAVNKWGYVTSTAIFDQYGNGAFAASTPEPSSSALVAVGLAGVLSVSRRRRLRR